MGLILVGTDGSEAGTAALHQALELARTTGDTVLVATVWQALQGDYGLVHPSAALLTDLLSAERRHAERVLDDAAAQAEAAGVPAETLLVTGDPAEQLCKLARERNARLVAVGTRGHSSVRSLLLGSVSGAVIRRAPCPVLVVAAFERRSEDVPAAFAKAV
jgi:nucleotide-binding universal stress UspA family protein